MPGTDLYPPLGYDWYWWLVLPLFVVLLVAWILLSRRAARVRGWVRQPVTPPAAALWTPRVDPRLEAMTRIQLVEDSLRSGQLTVRDAHLELSSILRDFAAARTGIDARTMTLEELRAARLEPVAELVESFYPIAFSPDLSSRVDDAIVNVRAVVRGWN